jgi:hypothetical protein
MEGTPFSSKYSGGKTYQCNDSKTQNNNISEVKLYIGQKNV